MSAPVVRSLARVARFDALFLLVALVFVLGRVAPADASEPITSFAVDTTDTQAGGHPDLSASFTLGNPGQPQVAKDITIDLPTGVFGNPGAIVRCSSADFALNECGSGSQVGLITIYANHAGDVNSLLGTAPLYNLSVEGADQTAMFSFVVPTVGIPISIPVSVRAGDDYGLRLTVSGIPQTIPLATANFTVWGFPADPAHDVDRFYPGAPDSPPGCPGASDTSCLSVPHPDAGQILRPYTDNPTVCTGQPLGVSLTVTTYQDSSHPTSTNADYPATTGCEKERFDPGFEVALTTEETDSPSGLDMQLKADQFLDIAPAPSELRSATVTLPEGLTINPDAADGQSSCSDAQANFGSDSPGNCPDNSKIGTVELHTPALESPLEGSLYFGEPKPGDQYRVFMILDGAGIHAKLFASVKPDPQTGQLTMSMVDLPQVPFEEFDIHLFASDRGLLATPTHCTLYKTDALFTPWNDQLAPQHSAPFISLNSGPNGSQCPAEKRPFNPRLLAGTSNPVAGDYSNFILRLDRDDGDQFLGDLNFTMPPGFTGSLRGIDYCAEAAIDHAAQNPGLTERAIPSCPASSQIGTTNVAAGPGSHPFHAVGKMYLAGPLNGAPLSLVAITPALAGPYDYGTVVVRVALHVDPLTAQVKAASDTVPSIIGGVPIRMRSIQVNIDRTDSQGRPNFTINPTNCSPFTVASQGIGDQGTVANFSSYFQVVNCAALPFAPKMTMTRVSGATRRSANPSLRINLDTRPGDANLKSLAVTLSNAFQIDQSHLGNICTETDLVKNHCAGKAQLGTATTTTPLLDQPLSGPVYAVSGSGGLPRLAFILGGQVTIIPRADATNSKGNRLKTTVPVIPDAPIGHFSFTLFGGHQGYLVNTRNICSPVAVSSVSYVAQNGKTLTQKMPLKGCPKAKKKASRHKRHHRRAAKHRSRHRRHR